MWVCEKCGTSTEGLFCTNCGAPMTEEGEKLNVIPETIIDSEPVVEKPTFKDVLIKVLSSKMYLAMTILYTVAFGFSVFNFSVSGGRISIGFNLDLITLFMVIGLFISRSAAKSGFKKCLEADTKAFGMERASVILAGVIGIIGAVALGLIGLFFFVGAGANSPELQEAIRETFAVKNGVFLSPYIKVSAVDMAMLREALAEISITVEELGAYIADNFVVIMISFGIVALLGCIGFVIFSVVNLKISSMFKAMDAKIRDNSVTIKFAKGSILLVQIFAVLKVINAITSFDLIAFLVNGGTGVALFFLARLLKEVYTTTQALEAEQNRV